MIEKVDKNQNLSETQNTINKHNLIYIYNNLNSTVAEYIVFSNLYETFSWIEQNWKPEYISTNFKCLISYRKEEVYGLHCIPFRMQMLKP